MYQLTVQQICFATTKLCTKIHRRRSRHFTWKLSGKVSWGISRIDFILLFFSPLEALFEPESWYTVLQLIMEIPTGSKVRYPDLVGSPSQATLLVPTSWFCPNFPPPPSILWLTSTSLSMLADTLSGGWPALPWRRGCSCNCHEAKGDNKVDNKLEVLVGLGIFVASTPSLWHVIRFSKGLVSTPSWNLIHFLDYYFPHNVTSSAKRSITRFSEALPPWGGSAIWEVCLGTLSNSVL